MSQETKDKISENRKGKCLGHKFWGNKDYLKTHAKELAEKRRKVYPKRKCFNPECNNIFQIVSKDLNKKFCSLPCANKYIGNNSKLGEYNKGRTPSPGSGRCKWYEYKSTNNGVVKVQGTWELRYAACLDKIGASWKTNHNKNRIEYKDENGVLRTYAPDFIVNGEYVEVKGFIDNKCRQKLDAVRKLGIRIKVITWAELKMLETNLFGKPQGGVNTPLRTILKLTA